VRDFLAIHQPQIVESIYGDVIVIMPVISHIWHCAEQVCKPIMKHNITPLSLQTGHGDFLIGERIFLLASGQSSTVLYSALA
jgi:hypothetical protein